MALLEGLDMQYLPERYQSLKAMYQDSVYQYAEALYDEKQPYQALVYYRLIADYRDVSSKKLTRTCYRLLGTWEDGKGTVMTFREDGTCTVEGGEHFFCATQFAIYLGDTAEFKDMAYTYNIYNSTEDRLNLKNEKTGVLYKMSVVKEP